MALIHPENDANFVFAKVWKAPTGLFFVILPNVVSAMIIV